MARIKVKDIPKDQKISKDELKRIRGGGAFAKYDGITYLQGTTVIPKLEINTVFPKVETTYLDPTNSEYKF